MKNKIIGLTTGVSKDKTVSAIRNSRILGGMHVDDNLGIGSALLAQGVIPEYTDLDALSETLENDPHAIVAFGLKDNKIDAAEKAATSGAKILIASHVVSEELIETIRAKHPSIVIISGASNEAEALEAINNRGDGIKIKPWGKSADQLNKCSASIIISPQRQLEFPIL